MATDAQASRFSEIARSILTQLADVTAVDPAYIKLAATDDYRLANLDQRWLVVRYFGPQPDTDAGVGRRARSCRRLFRVYIYTRNNLDQYGDDYHALLDDGAHSDLEELVIDALDEFVPTKTESETTKAIVIEPLHIVDASSAPPERSPDSDIGIVRSSIPFEVRYVLPNRNPQP